MTKVDSLIMRNRVDGIEILVSDAFVSSSNAQCNSPSDESSKILRKFYSLQRAAFEGKLVVLLSDTSWDQVCLPINKTGVGI